MPMPNHFRGTVYGQYPLLVPSFVCQWSFVWEVVNKMTAYGYSLAGYETTLRQSSGDLSGN